MVKRKAGGRGLADVQALLDFVNRDGYQPVPQRELLHRAQVPAGERPRVRRWIRQLVEEGKLIKLGGGRLASGAASGVVQGRLQRHRDGYGFVVPRDGSEDVFIPPHRLGDALTGDIVEAKVSRRNREGRLHGSLTRVLENRGRDVLGLYTGKGSSGLVAPFDPSFGEAIRIPAAGRNGAEDGQAVQIEVESSGGPGGQAQGSVVQLLGHIDEPGTDVRVVIRKYGLPRAFPEPVLQAAAVLPKLPQPQEIDRRERFDGPAPVTIDGETAKDFDDAIAVESLPDGGYRLFVHIADVAHFVAPGSALDLEALERGTSVYFPDRVLPMFPETLSNGLCSLVPGEDRLVQSAIIDFDSEGHAGPVRFADGVIRSAARLTYTQVADVLDGKQPDKPVPNERVPMLQAADRLRDLLERRRHARGSVDFDLPEPQILLDVEGVMTGITIEPRNKAHRLIEEFMLAANEAVGRYLENAESPAMYRVHEAPDPTKIESLQRFVEGYGLQLGGGADAEGPAAIQQLLEAVEGRPEARVISQVALRSMKQARYTATNVGHFGLASPTYLHFTSPIRRYPDLVVHRQLRAQRGSSRRAAGDDGTELEKLGVQCSERERRAEAAERELLVWKKVAFIADKVGQEFAGIVTGVARFGLFVQLIDNLVEGLIHVERLGDDWFDFDEGRFELIGTRSGKTFRLGDRLDVRVERVDRILQRVDMVPLDAEPRRGKRVGSRQQKSSGKRAPKRSVRK